MLRLLILSILCSCLVHCNGPRYHDHEMDQFASVELRKGSPWPLPRTYQPTSEASVLNRLNFQFVIKEFTCDILTDAFNRYYKLIFDLTTASNKLFFESHDDDVKQFDTLNVILHSPCGYEIKLKSDESYELSTDIKNPYLKAKSVWGILRGLETFSQLVYISNDQHMVNKSYIKDEPRFPWRGVLLDSSRHFLPVQSILNFLDAMAYNKMNVFHWHIVDDHSFPFQSSLFPDLSQKGAYRPFTHVYSHRDIAKILEYARLRGVRVVSEFDTPGHTQSWGKGQPGLLAECYSGDKLNGKYGPIDPTKNSNYMFLRKLFEEVVSVFSDTHLHLGGDEVDFTCWASNPAIVKFMKDMKFGDDYKKLENYYITSLMNVTSHLKKSYVVWQEVFEHGVQVSKDTIIHVWMSGSDKDLLANVTKAGLQALYSSPWYLDYVAYGAIWQKYYKADPTNFTGTPEQKSLVLGGEACLWAEYVDSTNVHSRLWPSASAVAERLWSDESVRNITEADGRLKEHRCRLLRRGVMAEPGTGPGYCDEEMVL